MSGKETEGCVYFVSVELLLLSSPLTVVSFYEASISVISDEPALRASFGKSTWFSRKEIDSFVRA